MLTSQVNLAHGAK